MFILEEKYYEMGVLYKKTYQIPVGIKPIKTYIRQNTGGN